MKGEHLGLRCLLPCCLPPNAARGQTGKGRMGMMRRGPQAKLPVQAHQSELKSRLAAISARQSITVSLPEASRRRNMSQNPSGARSNTGA